MLFSNGDTWKKKGSSDDLFDIPMGAYDGAESCEIVVCYILAQLQKEIGATKLGLYRDDGLAITHGTPREVENIKKKICRVFAKNKLKITIEANKKVVNFLDVTLNLESGIHEPYIKPGNTPQYIHVQSNHPPAVIKAVPEGINRRLSAISSDENVFKKSTKIYQEALAKSGFNYELNFKKEPENAEKPKRRRNITWYNPPFDLTVKTKIGKIFLEILDQSFNENNPLKRIFNRNTVKLSYSCMPNIKSTIDSHNTRKANTNEETIKECNCRNKDQCPLDGKCREKGIVYQATVTTNNIEGISKKETYVGLTETEFKTRLANHKQSFSKEKLRNATELSKFIWKLKEENIEYKIDWTILGRAKPYSNTTKKCNLCTLEKYFIICRKDLASLNQKCGLINSCRHSSKFILKNLPA